MNDTIRIKLKEKQFEFLIEESINQIKTWEYYSDFREFIRKNPKHINEFCAFSQKYSGIGVDLFFDKEANFLHSNHPLFMYFRNGNGVNERLIPVAIHQYKPFILDENAIIKISNDTLQSIYDFIKENYYTIIEFAKGRISQDEFYINTMKKVLKESLLTEMPTYDSKVTNLRTKIWIDNERPKQHAHRIKFQDTEDNNTRNWASMTIDKYDPQYFNLDKNTFLKTKDIEAIKDFVKTNYEMLLAAAQGKIKDSDDIKNSIIKYNPIDSKLYPNDNTVQLEFFPRDNNLYLLVKNNNTVSKSFIDKLCSFEPLKKESDLTAFVNLYDLKGNINNKIQIIYNLINKVAESLNIDVDLINTNKLKQLSY